MDFHAFVVGYAATTNAVRGHWSVERMHWQRTGGPMDVTFREDKNHTLNKPAAENMNIIRKWALALLKTLQLGKKYSLRLKRRILSWGFEQHLEAVLALQLFIFCG
jgi:hypothetical protein